jgi:pyruvate dehydrogenase E1 component alpha subunit
MADTQPTHEPKLMLDMLRTMVQIRRFEELAAKMYGLRKIGGFCHLYIGQEAVATGAIAALDLAQDYVITAYRDHGHALAVGMDPNVIMAELYGKASGCSHGKGGSMHLFDVSRHFFGGHGIVGAHIPLAAGIAFKISYRSEDGVVLCFFGDGAIHQGSFHETLNMSRLWNLPVVFICENNQYGMGTEFRRVSAVHDFSKLAGSYDIPGSRVDGMDALAVYDAVAAASELARKEKKPSLIEAVTYRYVGHSMSDPATYRTKEELAEHRKQDPIVILKERLAEWKLLNDQQYDAMDAECKGISQKAVEFAESAPPPAIESMYEDLYA